MKRGIGFLAAIVIGISAAPALALPLAGEELCEAVACEAPDQNLFDLGVDEYGNGANPALIPAPFQNAAPETALFTIEEATAPFLGPVAGMGSRVLIAVEAKGYHDLFTVYFPSGSTYLTLPAGDMVAMAAEAVRDLEGAEIWISADAALTPDLAAGRLSAVEGVLLENDVPVSWIHMDDGSVNAILNRPESLRHDLEL